MRDSREDIPRVSVGTVQDWERLKANYKRAALAQLEEHLLSNGLTHERDTFIIHLSQYIEQTFTMAQPNLRINGHNFESLGEAEQNTEPFDEALDRRIWSLADIRLQWLKRIADTRRSTPSEIEASLTELLNQRQAADTDSLSEVPEEKLEDVRDEDILPAYLQIQEGFQKTSVLGDELDQTIPSQQERAERVKVITAEVRTLKP